MDTLVLHTPSQLSLHLRSLRRSRGLTQADLAGRLNITQVRYSQIERNPTRVATGQLLDILAVLGVDVLFRLRPSAIAPATSRTPSSAPPPRGEDW